MSATRRGGARRRVGGPSRPRAGSVPAVLVLALAVLAVWLAPRWATQDVEPGREVSGSQGALVDQAVLACPGTDEIEAFGTGGVQRVRAGLVDGVELNPDGGVGEGPGRTEAGPPGAPGETLPLERGQERRVPGSGSKDSVVLRGAGAAAPGLFGFRVDLRPRSAATTPCLAPRADWWFAGAGGSLDHGSDLVVTNVDQGPAVVDVDLWDRDGGLDTVGTRGVALGPGETRAFALSEVAPGSGELVVAVRASQGQVVASVADRIATGPDEQSGTAWLVGAEQPTRRVLLGGVPGRAEERTLLVGNPSAREGLVQLRVAGAQGTFTPSSATAVSVPPETVRAVDLTELLPGGEPAALRLSSRTPVVATLRTTRPGALTYAGPSVPLEGLAVAPTVPGTQTVLLLTGGTEPARARVSGYTRSGQVTGRSRVDLAPGGTGRWVVPPNSDYAVVVPRRGTVAGGAVHSGARLTVTTPLVPAPGRVRIPRVVPRSG